VLLALIALILVRDYKGLKDEERRIPIFLFFISINVFLLTFDPSVRRFLGNFFFSQFQLCGLPVVLTVGE